MLTPCEAAVRVAVVAAQVFTAEEFTQAMREAEDASNASESQSRDES